MEGFRDLSERRWNRIYLLKNQYNKDIFSTDSTCRVMNDEILSFPLMTPWISFQKQPPLLFFL